MARDAEGAELQGLSGLGVRVVGQAEMEDTVHQQATRDMAEQELAVEGKRLVRVETALMRKQEQLAKARETASAAPTAARRQAAADRADRLEGEAGQLGADRAELLARIQALEQRAGCEAASSAEGSASRLASMVVPRRRAAAAAAETRNHALGHADSGSDVDVAVTDTALEPSGASDASYGASSGNESAGSESISDRAGTGITPRGGDQADDIHDDGDEAAYQARVYGWCTARWRSRQADGPGDREAPHDELMDEPFLPDPGAADHAVKAHDRTRPALLVPQQIWGRLLEYQRAGLRWLFALHQQGAGGILGDEMGLGKTVQTAAFLGALYHSRLLGRPTIIVCPATLMRQWLRELHAWWPVLRVAILHSTGYAMRTGAPVAPAEPARNITARLPADEVDVWEAARAADPRFGGRLADDAHASEAAGYNSADDYEYDAYGSRIRRKRKPRGTLDWRKRQRQAAKKARAAAPNRATRANLQRAHQLVDHVQRNGHVIIVTYSGLQVYRDVLLRHKWGYAVLDEGHMVRNPDAEVTLACKRLDTRHRLLVTGTPIQNNLTELWSLFDFIFPGRLGTLPVFTNQFAVPITLGGYASANPLQVRAAYRCACILRDLIEPHLLRRLKRDVARDLPKKTEQVLFCRLTPMQRTAYATFLRSGDMERILGGKLQMLYGVDVARKICDHLDLLLLSRLPGAAVSHREAAGLARNDCDSGASSSDDQGAQSDGSGDAEDAVSLGRLPADYGNWRKSGKMTIMRALLEMWQPQGHKVLIFSQTRQMLDIIERMVVGMGLDYRRMDGTTPIQHRTALVDEYNRTPSIFVFLLTTKVGGLGINLTGADRVILFSPDWNPSSDSQARERAWRLGQRRDVAVYRLMTAGTIEEKVYNRQIYKQFLSSKILEDPRQGRFFHSQSLRDLFSLADFDATDDAPPTVGSSSGGDSGLPGAAPTGPRHVTETGRMFAGAQLFPKPRPDAASAASGPADGDATPDTVEAINGLVRLEPFRATGSDKEGDSEQQQEAAERAQEDGDEDRVLNNLFQISGMHSVLQHDAIVSGGDGDARIIDQEAARIAQDARQALRESQRSRRGGFNVPTWTGASGQAGAQPHGVAVAPPPSAVLSGELPSAPLNMVAVGRPQRRPAPPTDGRFGAGTSSARPGGGASSATLLAGLRAGGDARVVGPRPRPAGTGAGPPALIPPGAAPTRLPPSSCRPRVMAPGRLFAPGAGARPPGSRRAAPPARPAVRPNDDRGVVERIRELLARHGGEVGHGALLKEFGREFPPAEQPRLRRLALQVAELVSHPSQGATGTGVGHAVRKSWRLKAAQAEPPPDRYDA